MSYLAGKSRGPSSRGRICAARSPAAATAAEVARLLSASPFDPGSWGAAVDADLHVRIANAAPALGKDAALRELAGFYNRIKALGSDYCEMYAAKETVFAEMEVTFMNSVGQQQRIPCVVVARLAGKRLLDIRFYLDPLPIP